MLDVLYIFFICLLLLMWKYVPSSRNELYREMGKRYVVKESFVRGIGKTYKAIEENDLMPIAPVPIRKVDPSLLAEYYGNSPERTEKRSRKEKAVTVSVKNAEKRKKLERERENRVAAEEIGEIDRVIAQQKSGRYNKNEERCRAIFEKLFGVPFVSVRPQWLKNPATNRCLELDGFNPSIETRIGKGLAFEYDGKQHSVFTRAFHGDDKRNFAYQLAKDNYKSHICKKNGVTLIRIKDDVKHTDFERHILSELEHKGVEIRKYSD